MAAENGQQRDDARMSDLAVLEANEYKQKRRLERILDAMDAVPDTADDAWAGYVQGEIAREAVNITIQRAVKNAIRECYKLLLDYHRNLGEDETDRYWAPAQDADVPLIGTVSILDERQDEIRGLRDFMESPRFYSTTVSERVQRPNQPVKVESRPVEVTMPEDVSYRAYLRLKEFLDDVHDLEIAFEEMDDSLPSWGFKSAEEVPEDAVVL